MRQFTKVYQYSGAEMQALFDEALASVQHSTTVFAPCLSAMLQYAAGMICFMCDPQWETYLYKADQSAEETAEKEQYLEGASYDAVAVGSGACVKLWAGCAAFSAAARDAWEKVLQCPLAKQIEQPLPDLPAFFSKPELCEWARAAIALQPLAETSRSLPQQRLPELPSDATTTSISSDEESQNREKEVDERILGEAHEDNADKGDDPSRRTSSPYAWGQWFLVAAFQEPDEVLVAKAPGEVGASLTFDENLGGGELGRVVCVAATSVGHGTPAELYTASVSEEDLTLETIVRYKYKMMEGKIILSAAVDVWPAPAAKRRVVGMVAFGGCLFVADDEGHISRLVAATMAEGERSDGKQLYATPIASDEKHQNITGLAVGEGGRTLYWSTATDIFVGPSDGSGGHRAIFGQEQLQKLGGSTSSIAYLAADPLDELLFFVVHEGATSQSCRVSRLLLPPRSGSVVTTVFEWPVEKLWLSAHSQVLYVASEHSLYSLPVNFSASVAPHPVFKDQQKVLTSFHSFHVRGTDCVLGDWQEQGNCTKTCGGGVQKLIRPILTPASGGGRPCSKQQIRHKECFDQPCPERATDCLMGQWINMAVCSATCGCGKLHQRRSVLRPAADGGAACPEEQERSVDCVRAECGGYDFLVAAMPGHGLVSSQLLAKQEEIDWTMSSAVGSLNLGSDSADSETLMAFDSDNRFLYLASSGGHSVTRWSVSVGDGHVMSFYAKEVVFTSKAHGTTPTIIDLKIQAAALFVATSDEKILRIDEDALLTSNEKAPLVQVLYKDLGRLRSLAAAGTYLLWATSNEVMLGTVDGPAPLVAERPVLNQKSLEDLVGSSSEVVQVELLWDASCFFLAAWDVTKETLSIFQVSITLDSFAAAVVEHQQLRQLRHTWSSRGVRMLASPFSAYVFSNRQVWSLPRHLGEDTSLTVLSKSSAKISGLAYFFQKGLDCAVSDWLNISLCSASCGGGLVRQAREILAEASEGGSGCPDELERELPCNELPCPLDCKMSGWKDAGSCSKSCGGGRIRQTRIVLSKPVFGGRPCSKLEQEVLCNDYPCEGCRGGWTRGTVRAAAVAVCSVSSGRC